MTQDDSRELGEAVKPHVAAMQDLAARADDEDLDLTEEELTGFREHAVAVKDLRDRAEDPDLRATLNDVLAQFGELAERLQART